MEESSTQTVRATPPPTAAPGPDRLSIKRWLAVYAGWLAALGVPAAWMLRRLGVGWKELFIRPGDFTSPADGALKLLIFVVYISLCCTFLPLPTSWLVSALATRDVALSESLLVTVLLVAGVGAAASTVANLHDYHMFTWMLRHKSIARVRSSRLYQRAAGWFDRRPFIILIIFNIIPIPVDVIRMLAASCRYGLGAFAAANFLGRWVRYAVIAAVTFLMGPSGWLISAALLAAAVVAGLGRLAARGIGRWRSRAGTSRPAADKMDP